MFATMIRLHEESSFLQLWSLGDSSSPETRNATIISEDSLQAWFTGNRRSAAVAGTGKLKIFHVNDTHHFHLGARPTRYSRSAAAPEAPLHSLAAILEGERLKAAQTGVDLLYLSAGDEHTGTALDELLGYTGEDFHGSVGYALQSEIGLDAAVIGNHDLDRGPEILEKAIRGNAAFPVLSANIAGSRFLKNYRPALLGETTGGTAVGIIGVTTDEQLQVRDALDPEFRLENPLEAARRWYTVLASTVDILIVVSHLGLNVPESRHQSRRDDRLLAKTLAEAKRCTPLTASPITIIVGGHTHTVIDPVSAPVVEEGIPIFQAGCNMALLGEINVDIARRETKGKLLPLGEPPTAEAAQHEFPQVEKLQESLNARVLRPVVAVHGATDADDQTTLEDRLSGECAVANMITDAIHQRYAPEEDNLLVVATDATGIQAGLTEEHRHGGLLLVEDFYRMLPYADSIYRADLSIRELREVLRSNAMRVLPRKELRSRGGTIGPMDWSKIARGFLHFSGNLRYKIVADPEKRTALDITVEGTAIDQFEEERLITVYCNSFSAMGNQGWGPIQEESFVEFGSVSLPALSFSDTTIPLRSALIETLLHRQAVAVHKDNRLIVEAAEILKLRRA